MSVQPSLRSMSCCCWVSTPSAVVVMWRAAAMFTTACTMQADAVGFDHVVDEAAIDLDLVERKRAADSQRGIAGAEIVERDAHAEFAQLMQHGQRGLVVTDQDRLGDLQLQPMRRQAPKRRARRRP